MRPMIAALLWESFQRASDLNHWHCQGHGLIFTDAVQLKAPVAREQWEANPHGPRFVPVSPNRRANRLATSRVVSTASAALLMRLGYKLDGQITKVRWQALILQLSRENSVQ